MRSRLPSPIRPFDTVPPYVVERCKLAFDVWQQRQGSLGLVDMRPGLLSHASEERSVWLAWRQPPAAIFAFNHEVDGEH